ncbi:DUF4251 domain-containing protein [Winogradskyella sp. PG-2]|uniref:DUF4251 domain-containing protein n=1 Tax=Winogradskyella sp. PG-2 TaxID=754409 RepID=UPI00045866AF|nr:DUF4251 domain-containing protein [Winogradskyella sp. PG-2]BAO77402.1 hypothetical protein WPG_3172 [Winogradskyella sp. PG-2]
MKKIILLVAIFSISATTYSCAQSKSTQKEKFQSTYNNSKALVENHTYQFVGDLVYNNKRREKLGDNAIININKSSVSGEMVGLTNDRKSFIIDGKIEGYKNEFNDEKQHISIEFSVGERKVFIDIKPNGNAFLTVSSGPGNSISWTGRIE